VAVEKVGVLRMPISAQEEEDGSVVDRGREEDSRDDVEAL
jgi:hypothetical protein